MTTLEKFAEELRDYLALGSDTVKGVNIEPIGNNKIAIPVKLKDGTLFGIVVEKIK